MKGGVLNRFASIVAALAAVAVVAVVMGVAASPAAAEACFPVPVQHPPAAVNFTSLTAVDVPCPEASEVALHVAKKGSGPADWSCSPTVNGRFVSWACVDRLIVSRKVDFTYRVL